MAYLKVAFSNPGYVTSYILRGEEQEEDFDELHNHKNRDNLQGAADEANRRRGHKKQKVNTNDHNGLIAKHPDAGSAETEQEGKTAELEPHVFGEQRHSLKRS